MPLTRRQLFPAPLALALAGCGASSNKPAARGRGTADAPWRIGMSQCNLGEPWRVQMNRDLTAAAAAHPNIELIAKDAQNNSLTQRAHVEEFGQQGVDLLIISPKESAPLTRPVAQLYKAGTPVIVLDRAVQGDAYTTFIGADNRKIGEAAGKWCANILGGSGKIVELQGLMTSTPGQQRHEGFRAGLALAAHPELEVVFVADMQWLEPNARREMESALATQPQVDLVFAHNDPGAHGAYLAAKAAGREQDIRFVGVDALPHEGVAYVREGLLDATFAYPTGGAETIATAIKILKGEQVPKHIDLATKLFTRDNVDAGGEALGA